MKKIFIFLFFVIIFQIPFVSDSFGLSCAPQTLNEIYEDSDIVFLGTVISKEYWPPSTGEAKITLEIQDLLKGTHHKTIILSSNESFWGHNFGAGVQYVVFAQGNQDKTLNYSVGLCTPVFYGFESIVKTIELLQTNENTDIGNMEAWRIYDQLTEKEQSELEKIREFDRQRIQKERETQELSNNIFSYLVIFGIIVGISIGGYFILKILQSKKISINDT